MFQATELKKKKSLHVICGQLLTKCKLIKASYSHYNI